MQKLKDYFAASQRMNRKIFVLFILAYIVFGMIEGLLIMPSAGNMSAMMKSVMEVTQEQARQEITAEEAHQKLAAIRAAQMTIPLWHYIVSFLTACAFIPAVMMRLKDLGWQPELAFLILITAIMGLLSQTMDISILRYSMMAVSVIYLIMLLLLIFMKGTKGANKYGADPLEMKIAAV